MAQIRQYRNWHFQLAIVGLIAREAMRLIARRTAGAALLFVASSHGFQYAGTREQSWLLKRLFAIEN